MIFCVSVAMGSDLKLRSALVTRNEEGSDLAFAAPDLDSTGTRTGTVTLPFWFKCESAMLALPQLCQ